MQQPTIIEVLALKKNFGAFEALRGVSFSVAKGEICGFLGPNGAGKSTTLRCMLTLIQPDSGSISIFDKPLHAHRGEILQKIGCIIEKPDFYKYLSAYRNLEVFGNLSTQKVSKSKIYEMLDFVGLGGRERDKFAGFSHGMRQRLGIAQALLHDPDLIILDEPTTGLDPQGIIDVRNLILSLKNDHHKTVLLSSHLLSEIELIADSMVIINKGQIVANGAVRDLLHAEDMVVVLEVDRSNEALVLLRSQLPQYPATVLDSGQLELHLSKAAIPAVVHLLSTNEVKVFAVESKRKLEAFFLKMIGA
jgi:ABC-type multidrug transport system ATPase subunit